MPLPVTESLIRERSTPESFARGQTYYQEEAVGAIVRRGNAVQAEVEGSEPLPYRVTLVFDDQGETTRALAAAEIAVKEVPTLEGYRRARELAGNAWPAHRDTLLAHLRRLPGYMSGAVEILLDEGLIKDAIAVVDRGASHRLLERVAEAAVPSYPEWVIKTSRREAEWQAYQAQLLIAHSRKYRLVPLLKAL